MSNEPATIWIPASGVGEFTNTAPEDIVDPTGVSLVDPSGVQIVSPDSTFTPTPATQWVTSDGS